MALWSAQACCRYQVPSFQFRVPSWKIVSLHNISYNWELETLNWELEGGGLQIDGPEQEDDGYGQKNYGQEDHDDPLTDSVLAPAKPKKFRKALLVA
jgi:hypothetical protein